MRKLLNSGKISPETVKDQPTTSLITDTAYGSQHCRTNLPRPWKLAWRPPCTSSRKVRTYMSLRGERLSAKKALRRFPRLRTFLLRSRNLTQSMLEAKLGRFYKKGQIPFDTILCYNIVQDATRRLRENTVGHYVLENPDKGASPKNFLTLS